MKIIVIVGPTASGKSAVGIRLARSLSEIARSASAFRTHRTIEYGSFTDPPRRGSFEKITSPRGIVEVISADSRAIYRGMDVGTAKPTREEQAEVKHWGIDIANPGERFTVADWKEYAERKIEEIRGRGNWPMIVGGTGLYIDALIFDYNFSERHRISQEDRQKDCSQYLIIGIKTEPEELRARITERVNKMFNDKLYQETEELVRKYSWFLAGLEGRKSEEGWKYQAAKSNIYQFAWQYLQGEISLEEAKRLAALDDWHLAKRQMTWFKRNKNIQWMGRGEVVDFVVKEMAEI